MTDFSPITLAQAGEHVEAGALTVDAYCRWHAMHRAVRVAP